MGKYGNRRSAWGDKVFDSSAELSRYLLLRNQEAADEITDLVCQPQFELVPAFVDSEGKKVRAIGYTADFSYRLLDGTLVVEDVKSAPTRTQAYQLRVKLLKWAVSEGRVPPLVFREVM